VSFNLQQPYPPAGDQPAAIARLSELISPSSTDKYHTLLGVTGSGKTYTVANLIQNCQQSTLVMAHNKTLAAQLFNEFKGFFPKDEVHFFISYYDYYQPESYIPTTDTYIEKTAKINQEIDRLRHAATKAIFEKDHVIVIASVSAIYGLGAPEEYFKASIPLEQGQQINREELIMKLVTILFERNDIEPGPGKFRVRGDIIDISPSEAETLVRVEFFGDEIEALYMLDPISGKLDQIEKVRIYPAKHYVADQETIDKACPAIEEQLKERLAEMKAENKTLEAARLEQRTKYDLEMLHECGYCNGIENYSAIIEGRLPGSAPQTLIDYFQKRYDDKWLCVLDESHITTPQLKGMYRGDASRKQTLIDFGFRLPCARDNRPLKIEEFWQRTSQILFVSATPGDFERESSAEIVEQVIRPTGLLDPTVEVQPIAEQIDDLTRRIKERIARNEKVLITTLTKKYAEDLTDYLQEAQIRAKWLHSELKSLERVEILQDLRAGHFDVLIGVNLLREGIDLPEVSLVAILDADKEGFLRSKSSLIQTIGRTARNAAGEVVLYADHMTDSMQAAMNTVNDYRMRQIAHNKAHGITPRTIHKKSGNPLLSSLAASAEQSLESAIARELAERKLSSKDLPDLIAELETQMLEYAKDLEFERAAQIRDKLKTLKEKIS